MSMYSVVMVWAAVCLVGSAQARQQDNPYADHTVLVESFMVELTTEAVREAGADIVDRDPDGISITKLLWALRDEDNGQVESGLKINAVHGQRNVQVQEEVTQYYPISNPQIPDSPTQFQRFSTSRALSVKWINIISANSVLLSYTYSENTVIPSKTNAGPAVAKTTFAGNLTAMPGVPVIAGASQNDDTVRILVFVVTLVAPAEPLSAEKQATAGEADKIIAFLDESIPTVLFDPRRAPVDSLRQLSRMYEVNIIPSQNVSELRGPFSFFQLYDVTFDEILEALPGDYRYVIDGKFIRIYTAEEFAEMQKDTPEDTPEVAPQAAPEPAVDAPAQGLRHEDRRRDDR